MSVEMTTSQAFLSEAKKNTLPDARQSLQQGETGWISGTPVKSEPGTVAVRTPNGFIIVLSEPDVVEYARNGQAYMIRARAGADVLTRFESVSKLLPTKAAEPCDCHDAEGSPATARINTQSGPPDRPLIRFGCYACWIEYVDAWCELPGGILFKCYQPRIRCGNVCPPPVIV